MPEWVVPVTYELHVVVVVDAETAEEAKVKAADAINVPAACELLHYTVGKPRRRVRP